MRLKQEAGFCWCMLRTLFLLIMAADGACWCCLLRDGSGTRRESRCFTSRDIPHGSVLARSETSSCQTSRTARQEPKLNLISTRSLVEIASMSISQNRNKLKVLLLQLNANNSASKTNIREKIVRLLDSRKLDPTSNNSSRLIVLPELAYHRYIFEKQEDAKADDSLIEYFKFLSKRYNSYVISGFIEEDNGKKYNSSVCIREDEIVKVHRKKHLYFTDDVWAEEGETFSTFQLKLGGSKEITCSMGICMDINPYKFQAPFEKYEYASYCCDNNVDLAVLPTAWTHQISVLQGEDENSASANKKKAFLKQLSEKSPWLVDPNVAVDPSVKGLEDGLFSSNRFLFNPCFDTLNYWYARFKPLHDKKNRYLLFCDKVGIEKNVLYAGSSACLKLNENQVALEGCLSTAEEAILEVDLEF